MKYSADIMLKALTAFNKTALDQLATSRDKPVIPQDLPKLMTEFIEPPLPMKGQGVLNTIEELHTRVIPGMANTSGPRAFPWVVGGVTPAALLGAMHQILFDQTNMTSGASISPKFEVETIKLLLDLFRLSRDTFEGTLTTGATASNLCGLACARQWYGKQHGIDIATDGMSGIDSIPIFAATAHSSVNKVLGILGLGRASLQAIPTLPGREAIDISALEVALKACVGPKIVIASAGTVNCGDFDDINAVADLCERYNAWLHVDGAFGLFARCSKEYESLAYGIERAHSITSDGHKWLNVPYDCGIFFIRHDCKNYLTSSFSAVADYMSKSIDEPMNKGVENSRALRAMPVWSTLKAYGKSGYAELVERNCTFAKAVGEHIDDSGFYQLLTPVHLNIVLFRGRYVSTAEENKQLADAINATGKLFITSTVYCGAPALRIAVSNWQTTMEDDFEATVEGLDQGANIYIDRMNMKLRSTLFLEFTENRTKHNTEDSEISINPTTDPN